MLFLYSNVFHLGPVLFFQLSSGATVSCNELRQNEQRSYFLLALFRPSLFCAVRGRRCMFCGPRGCPSLLPGWDHGVSDSELHGIMTTGSRARLQRRSTSKSMTTQCRVVTWTLLAWMYPLRSL